MAEKPILILLAEDDEGHACLIKRNLQRIGVPNEVAHVRDGQEALDYVYCRGAHQGRENHRALILLLDINMPRVDGIEVLRRVKTDKTTATIPVIMLTTAEEPIDVDRCYRLGCAAYVTKPIPYNTFAETVKRLGNFLGIVQVPLAKT